MNHQLDALDAIDKWYERIEKDITNWDLRSVYADWLQDNSMTLLEKGQRYQIRHRFLPVPHNSIFIRSYSGGPLYCFGYDARMSKMYTNQIIHALSAAARNPPYQDKSSGEPFLGPLDCILEDSLEHIRCATLRGAEHLIALAVSDLPQDLNPYI